MKISSSRVCIRPQIGFFFFGGGDRDRDIIESQPNLSLIALSHIKDSLEAKEEIELIVKGISRFDNGLTVSKKIG